MATSPAVLAAPPLPPCIPTVGMNKTAPHFTSHQLSRTRVGGQGRGDKTCSSDGVLEACSEGGVIGRAVSVVLEKSQEWGGQGEERLLFYFLGEHHQGFPMMNA